MTISDEQLMAYADGELPDDQRAAVEAAIANDAALAAQVSAHRALRGRLADAFDGVLSEPAPARLTELLGAAPPAAASSAAQPSEDAPRVISLEEKREARAQERARRRWSWPEWGAIAASVIVGVSAGSLWLQGRSPIGTDGGTLVARGELAAALSHQLAADAPGAVRVGVSFRARDGSYCRTFTYQATAGLACRVGEQWSLPMLAQSAPAAAGNAYRQAASMPAAILDAVDARIDGPALDAAAEKAAAARGWTGGH
jgi:hypothetical protein